VSKKGKPMKVSLSKNNLPWGVKRSQTNETQFVNNRKSVCLFGGNLWFQEIVIVNEIAECEIKECQESPVIYSSGEGALTRLSSIILTCLQVGMAYLLRLLNYLP
jgi:hypothetical protein